MKHIAKSTVAKIIGVVSFLLFAIAVPPVPHAGTSAALLAQKLGVSPLPLFSNPLYGWVIQGIAAVAGNAVYYVINLFSAACAAVVLTLVFSIVYRVTPRFNVENSLSLASMHLIQLFSGVVAVMYLLAATPVWLAATRAGPLPFDLMLLLSAFYLVASYTGKSSASRMMFAVFLYGVCIVEFTTAILFAPLFGVLVLVMLYSTGNMRPGLFVKLLGCGVAGLSLYLVQAGVYALSPVYEWREFKSFFQVIWYIWLEQYQTLTRGLPRVGWLTLALVSVLPWVVTYTMNFSRKLGVASGAIIGRIALHIVLLALAVVLLLDVPLSPAVITGTTFIYLTPYVLIALWVGNVAAFWSVALSRTRRFERPWETRTRTALAYVFVIALPVFLITRTAIAGMPAARDERDVLIQKTAVALVDAAAEKRWIISNTFLDDHIALEINRRDLPLTLIRTSLSRSPVYMKYIAGMFTDRPRLESLALVGFGPFVEEWFSSDTKITGEVVVVNVPELWLAAKLEAMPDRFMYRGAGAEAESLDELLVAARSFWSGLGAEIMMSESGETPAGASIGWLKIHLSKTANNLGVLLEDAGRSDDAMACYEQARKFEPENLSALMNMHVLSDREKRPGLDALEAELQEKTKDIMGKVQAMSLSQVYGYVRVPDLFVRRGMTFALSGKPDMAVAELKRALALREGNSQLQLALAGLFYGQQQDEQSKEYYLQVLAENPKEPQAIAGLMRIAARQGDFVEARRLLAALKETGMSESVIKTEAAFLLAIAGASAPAMRALQDVVKSDEKNVVALTALAAIATELGETDIAEGAIKKMQEGNVFSPALNLVLAQAAMGKGNRERARSYIEETLRRQPGYVPALEMMLRVELFEGNRDAVEKLTEQILNIEPRNAIANYMLGVFHYYREEYLLAEAAYRASIATRKTPEALNDLAYVLYLQRRTEEAEPLIRESIVMNDRNAPAWDTLGTILMALDKLDESQQALQQSLALRPDNASVMLSLALLYEKQGRTNECESIARQVNARQNELSSEQQGTIRELIRRLDNPG